MPVALLASLLVAADAGVDADVSTWVDLAQAHQARLEAHRPRVLSLHVRTHTLGGDGQPTSTQHLWLRQRTDSDQTELLKATTDGRDETEKAKAEHQKRETERREKKKTQATEKDPLRAMNPFAPGEQWAYRYHRLPDDPQHPGEIRLGFAPKKPAKDRTQGEARLDAQGQVLEVRGSPSVLPTLADEVRFVLEFGRPSEQGPALSSLTFEGKGGVLFIKKHVRSVTTIRVGDVPPEG